MNSPCISYSSIVKRSFPFKLHENFTFHWCNSSIISSFLSLWNNLTSPLRILSKVDSVLVTLLIRSCKLRLFDCSVYRRFTEKFPWILQEQQKSSPLFVGQSQIGAQVNLLLIFAFYPLFLSHLMFSSSL